MAMSESPEISGSSTATVIGTSHSESDLNHFALRRRAVSNAVDAGTRVPESKNSGNGETVDARDRMESANFSRENVNENQTNSDTRFTYRPSVPAHWRIKESPLSSDNIFQQVPSTRVFSFEMFFIPLCVEFFFF